MPLRDKLASLKKLQKVQGIDKILPANWRRPSNGQELINSSTILLPAYSLIACVSAAVFAVQWVYYGSLTETISEVADVTLGGYTCSAMQKDSIYEKKLTYEGCLTSSEYSAPSTVSMIGKEDAYGNWNYIYFPFGANNPDFVPTGNCAQSRNVSSNGNGFLINFSQNFDLSTSCPGIQVEASCGFSMLRMQRSTGMHYEFTPFYVGTTASGGFSVDGAIWQHAKDVPSRCEAYEKQCVVQAINQIYAMGEGEACNPCEHFKSNSPFNCKKEQKKKLLEILSLSVSNTLAVFSLLVAVAPMFLAKSPSAEQDLDVEETSK